MYYYFPKTALNRKVKLGYVSKSVSLSDSGDILA